MAHSLHGYVLTLAPIPVLVSMFKEAELERMLLVKAEIEVLREHRLAKRDSMSVQFAERHEVHQAAQMSGHMPYAIRYALDDAVTTRYAADSLLMESSLMTTTIDHAIADCRSYTSDQVTSRLPGYTLSLVAASALVNLLYPKDELARLLALRAEVEILRVLRKTRLDKARKECDELEGALALACNARGKGKVMRDIRRLISEANQELSQATIHCDEGRLMAEAVDINIPRCRGLIVG
ncbi:uncharacterized protein LOC113286299 [Papaver somniferum]|uniref:uncharacterized protein LOC113286299 n=1 Tax=Papaver somniferum TaxID=3469 RepID=UPI000E6FA38F|nr:uncharacterized protein LOC113286299 [Papaver somniferum]XP_026390745.1 uncharacterized protein LOC113286299 [Papaver somniferum]